MSRFMSQGCDIVFGTIKVEELKGTDSGNDAGTVGATLFVVDRRHVNALFVDHSHEQVGHVRTEFAIAPFHHFDSRLP